MESDEFIHDAIDREIDRIDRIVAERYRSGDHEILASKGWPPEQMVTEVEMYISGSVTTMIECIAAYRMNQLDISAEEAATQIEISEMRTRARKLIEARRDDIREALQA